MKQKSPLTDWITKPLSPHARGAAMRALIIGLLLVLLFIVLLPLFWMILTAFKKKGTAFQLRFLPQTEILTPELGLPALRIPVIDPNESWLYIQHLNPSATTVEALVNDQSGESSVRMVRGFGGLWTAVHGPVSGSEAAYRLVINGEEAIPDPLHGEATREGMTIVPITGVGINSIGERSGLVYREGNTIVAEFLSEGPEEISLLLDDATPLLLRREGGNALSGRVTSNTAETWRAVENVPFSVALGRLYTTENFEQILNNPDFAFSRYFMNSLVVAGSCAFLTVLICTLASYAFVLFPFHYRDQLFLLLLSSMLVPGMIFLVPQFSITLSLGMMNSYAGMVVPHLGNVFGLFLMKQYISQIPKDLFAAAEIDGANDAQVFKTVIVPICLPIMVTLFLLVFVTQWSNFLWQLIINTGDSKVLTLPVGLQQFKGQNANEWEKIMAGACFSILPISILFLSLQKYFLQGLTAGSVKE